MELEDCGFDLLQEVVVTSDASIAFKGGTHNFFPHRKLLIAASQESIFV
jgi:hypothetical protein